MMRRHASALALALALAGESGSLELFIRLSRSSFVHYFYLRFFALSLFILLAPELIFSFFFVSLPRPFLQPSRSRVSPQPRLTEAPGACVTI